MKCYIRFNSDLSRSEARVISESIEGVYLNQEVALGATHGPVISVLLNEEKPNEFYQVTVFDNGAIGAELLTSPPPAKAMVPRVGDTISVVAVEAQNENDARKIARGIIRSYSCESLYDEW